MFGRSEFNCWGDRAKGVGHARAGVGMTVQGDFEAEEYGQRVGKGGATPKMESATSSRCDVGERVMGFS